MAQPCRDRQPRSSHGCAAGVGAPPHPLPRSQPFSPQPSQPSSTPRTQLQVIASGLDVGIEAPAAPAQQAVRSWRRRRSDTASAQSCITATEPGSSGQQAAPLQATPVGSWNGHGPQHEVLQVQEPSFSNHFILVPPDVPSPPRSSQQEQAHNAVQRQQQPPVRRSKPHQPRPQPASPASPPSAQGSSLQGSIQHPVSIPSLQIHRPSLLPGSASPTAANALRLLQPNAWPQLLFARPCRDNRRRRRKRLKGLPPFIHRRVPRMTVSQTSHIDIRQQYLNYHSAAKGGTAQRPRQRSGLVAGLPPSGGGMGGPGAATAALLTPVLPSPVGAQPGQHMGTTQAVHRTAAGTVLYLDQSAVKALTTAARQHSQQGSQYQQPCRVYASYAADDGQQQLVEFQQFKTQAGQRVMVAMLPSTTANVTSSLPPALHQHIHHNHQASTGTQHNSSNTSSSGRHSLHSNSTAGPAGPQHQDRGRGAVSRDAVSRDAVSRDAGGGSPCWTVQVVIGSAIPQDRCAVSEPLLIRPGSRCFLMVPEQARVSGRGRHSKHTHSASTTATLASHATSLRPPPQEQQAAQAGPRVRASDRDAAGASSHAVAPPLLCLTPQPVLLQPCLLVADVAMVAGRKLDPRDDQACARFRDVWCTSQLLNSSMLVYNTHRSWQWFNHLWRDKQHVLQPPDVLLLSGGTRVMYRVADGSWVEDTAWKQQLNRQWNRQRVVTAVQQVAHLLNSQAVAAAADGDVDASNTTYASSAGSTVGDATRAAQGSGSTATGATQSAAAPPPPGGSTPSQPAPRSGHHLPTVMVKADTRSEQNCHLVRVLVRQQVLSVFTEAVSGVLQGRLDVSVLLDDYRQQQQVAAAVAGPAVCDVLPLALPGGSSHDCDATTSTTPAAQLAQSQPVAAPVTQHQQSGAACVKPTVVSTTPVASQPVTPPSVPSSSLSSSASSQLPATKPPSGVAPWWSLTVHGQGTGLPAGWCVVDITPRAASPANAVQHVLRTFGIRPNATDFPLVCASAMQQQSQQGLTTLATYSLVYEPRGSTGGSCQATAQNKVVEPVAGGGARVSTRGWGAAGLMRGLEQLGLLSQ